MSHSPWYSAGGHCRVPGSKAVCSLWREAACVLLMSVVQCWQSLSCGNSSIKQAGQGACHNPCSPSILSCLCACILVVLQDGDDPDVWLQLAKVCASHPECQVLVVEGLLEQVAYQEQELALQQDRSAQQQERIDQQQRQIAQLQEQLAAASAQAGEAAELRGRVQALEGQLQQVMQALQHRRA